MFFRCGSVCLLNSLVILLFIKWSESSPSTRHVFHNCEVDNLPTPEGFTYTPTAETEENGAKGSVGIVGDVNDVLKGVVTPETESIIWTSSSTGQFGLGAGAIGPLNGMGEAIFINGEAFVKQTDNQTSNYFQTISGNEFRTPFAISIQNESEADGRAVYYTRSADSSGGNMTILDFFSRVHESIGKSPFCLYGLTEFRQLDAVAISKAPIYSEPLFGDNLKNYYAKPPFHFHNDYGIIIGCAANFRTIQNTQLKIKLGKALYVNPLDSGSKGQLHIHCHVLTLRRCLKNVEEIDASSALEVFHLLSNSTVAFIDASVHKIDRQEKLTRLDFKMEDKNCAPNLKLESSLLFIFILFYSFRKYL